MRGRMTYPDAWRSIEARIHSIAKAAELNQVFGTNTDNWGPNDLCIHPVRTDIRRNPEV